MHLRRLSQLIGIKGGSPVPFYESAVLPLALSVIAPALQGRTTDLGRHAVFAILSSLTLPKGWSSVFEPKDGLPQWGIEIAPDVVKTTLGFAVEAPLRVYFGIATAKEVSNDLRSLYVRDLPITDTDVAGFEGKHDDNAAWLTLFVFLRAGRPDWHVVMKPSHKVQGRMTLEGEVLGRDLV